MFLLTASGTRDLWHKRRMEDTIYEASVSIMFFLLFLFLFSTECIITGFSWAGWTRLNRKKVQVDPTTTDKRVLMMGEK